MGETIKINGSFIRYYRERKGLTQEQLGNAIGVSQAAITNWEHNEIPKRWRYYKAVCDALDIESVDLLALDSKMLYEWLTLKFKESLLADDTLEISRLSQQIRQWEIFFSTGKFQMDEVDPNEITPEDAQRQANIDAKLDRLLAGRGDDE